MNILAIPVQSISDLITNSSSEVFILDTGKTCEEVNDILKGFTSGFAYPEVFSLKDYREWRKKLRSGEIEEGWLKDPEDEEPIHAAMVINVQDKTIHKRQAYKCGT